MDKAKRKEKEIDSDDESEYQDMDGEIEMTDDLKITQLDQEIAQPELDPEDMISLKQRLVPIYQQTPDPYLPSL